VGELLLIHDNASLIVLERNPPLPPVSPGIESLLKEMCNRLAGVESKLTKLDSIEERINSQFKHFDSELVSCKDRIGVLEHSAQFLSNIHDEQVQNRNV
jgi:hypothetical protein